jgi:O-antigen/teichoic acid export membrane protein
VSNAQWKSGGITLGSQLVAQCVRFAGNIWLARLLDESQFGINTLLVTITTGLVLLSDLGIAPAIIRSQRDDDTFLHTAFTLNFVRGVVLFGIGSALAVVFAFAYEQPSLMWWVPLACAQVVISGLESMNLYVALRRQQVVSAAVIDIVSQVAGLLTSVAVAYATRSVGALVAAALLSALVRTIATHQLAGPRMRFAWDADARVDLLHFGRWVLLSTALTFVAQRFDVFALGKLQGFALLGVYGLATQIVMVPWSMTLQLGSRLLLPVLAEAERTSRAHMHQELHRVRALCMPVGALLFCGAATTAPLFFELLYKPNFHDAGWLTQLLLLPAWWVVLQELSTRPLLAMSEVRSLAMINAVRVVVSISATMIGFQQAGFHGFVVGSMVGAASGVIMALVVMHRRGFRTTWLDLRAAVVMAVFLLALWLCSPSVAQQLPSMLATRGIASVLLGAPVCAAIAYVVWQRRRSNKHT